MFFPFDPFLLRRSAQVRAAPPARSNDQSFFWNLVRAPGQEGNVIGPEGESVIVILSCGWVLAQYLDLDRTYVHWRQVHGDSDDEEPSDVSSDEEVEAASEFGERNVISMS
jgi:hypothetical protein